MASFDVVHDLAVTPNGIVHFVAATGDDFTFGPFTVDPGSGQGSVVARVNGDLSAGIGTDPMMAKGIVACPSVFNSSFHLLGTDRLQGPARVMILDVAGRICEQSDRSESELGREVSPGTYTVLLRSGDRVLRTRVVKE